jgi:hypothetical protein
VVDSGEHIVEMMVLALVGGLVALAGLLILMGRIPMPGGIIGRWLVGGICFAAGILIALGYLGAMA